MKKRAFCMDIVPERYRRMGCAWKDKTQENHRCGKIVTRVFLVPYRGTLGGRLVRLPVCKDHEKRIRREFQVGSGKK